MLIVIVEIFEVLLLEFGWKELLVEVVEEEEELVGMV
jgi:hypothetical protein